MLYQSTCLFSWLDDLFVHLHSYCTLSLLFTLSMLCDFVCLPHLRGLWGKEYEFNKGNAAKIGMIWDTINVILHVPQAEIFFFFLPFLNVYDCDCGSLCNLYACGSFLVVDLLYVCVCVLRKTTLNLLIVTQRTGRMPSVRNCRTSVCTSCDSSCLFVFLPYMSSDIFYFFSLSLSFSLWLL